MNPNIVMKSSGIMMKKTSNIFARHKSSRSRLAISAVTFHALTRLVLVRIHILPTAFMLTLSETESRSSRPVTARKISSIDSVWCSFLSSETVPVVITFP